MSQGEPAMQSAEVNRRTNAADQAEMEIDLIELMYRLIEKLKYIVVVAILGAVIAALFTFYLVTPMYTATAKLYVVNNNDTALNLSDLQIGNYLASDYQEVFSNWHVHEMVLQRLGLDYSYSQLSKMISVSNPSDTRILYITATAADPQEAVLIADTYADVACEFIAVKMDTKQPNVFEEALLPSRPSSPNTTRNILLGFLLGMILTCGVITVQFIMDDRIRSAEDLDKYLNMATLGVMPMQSQKVRKTTRDTSAVSVQDKGDEDE